MILPGEMGYSPETELRPVADESGAWCGFVPSCKSRLRTPRYERQHLSVAIRGRVVFVWYDRL